MKIFLDSEFVENGSTVDLISIALITEDNRTYYAINRDCNFSKANQWVKDNVLNQLPSRDSNLWKNKETIRDEVAIFCGCEKVVEYIFRNNMWLRFWEELLFSFGLLKPKVSYCLKPGKPKPEFWADYGSYDWIVFCQLFGKMVDLPEGFPMYINDLQQWSAQCGNPTLPKQLTGNHSALSDALHLKKQWEYLKRCDNRLKVIWKDVFK